jgi:large subunit ribosomal protein L6
MSRIGKKPVSILDGVTVEIEKPRTMKVKGPKGTLSFRYEREMSVAVNTDAKEVTVSIARSSKRSPALWGTTARILENMIIGVKNGFEKKLELNGVGYRMALKGKSIDLALGFSHPVVVPIPEDIEVKIENNVMTISGIDKRVVGQFTANIRALKPVEPYKGKGFRYVGEIVRRKEGKKAGSGS